MRGRDLAKDLGVTENLLKGLALVAGFRDFKPSDVLDDVTANKIIATWAAGEVRPIALYDLARELKVSTVEVIRMCRRLGIVAVVPNDQITEYDSLRIKSLASARQISPSQPPGKSNVAAGGARPVQGAPIHSYSLLFDQDEVDEVHVTSSGFAEPADGLFDQDILDTSGSSPIGGRTSGPRWPSVSQYDDALLNAKDDFLVEHLRNMQVISGDGGDSSIFSTGAFACVAKILVDDVYWALRMFVRSQDEIVERYRAIRSSQDRGELTGLLAPVEYYENAVRVNVDGVDAVYPVVLVQWIDGLTFSRFVVQAYEREDLEALNQLVIAMRGLRNEMVQRGVAHGDLSPDNMIVEETATGIEVRLLDYDSLWFPEISDLRCSVSEDGDFQHPLRPNPIGPMADQVAIEMYDLSLRFLTSGEKIEGLRNLFDQRILMSREEWIHGSSALARRLQSFDQSTYDQIALCLLSDYSNIQELLLQGDYSDIGLPDESVDLPPEDLRRHESVSREGLTLDQVSAVLEISSGRLAQIVRGMGRDPEDLFSDDDLEVFQQAVNRSSAVPTVGVSESASAIAVEVPENGVSMSEVARRIGLDVPSAATLVQDVVGRSIGFTSSITHEELDEVRGRMRDDHEFKFDLNKVCNAAGMSPKRGRELLVEELPDAICIRPYSVRVNEKGRNFLMRYLQNTAFRNAHGTSHVQSNNSRVGAGAPVQSRPGQHLMNVHKVAAAHGLSNIETRAIAKLAIGYDPGELQVLNDIQVGILERRIAELTSAYPVLVEGLARELAVSIAVVQQAIYSLPDHWRATHSWDKGGWGRVSLAGRETVIQRLRDIGMGVSWEESPLEEDQPDPPQTKAPSASQKRVFWRKKD